MIEHYRLNQSIEPSRDRKKWTLLFAARVVSCCSICVSSVHIRGSYFGSLPCGRKPATFGCGNGRAVLTRGFFFGLYASPISSWMGRALLVNGWIRMSCVVSIPSSA